MVIDLDGLWLQCEEMMKYIVVSSLCGDETIVSAQLLPLSPMGENI